jgi:hypothetical protein
LLWLLMLMVVGLGGGNRTGRRRNVASRKMPQPRLTLVGPTTILAAATVIASLVLEPAQFVE